MARLHKVMAQAGVASRRACEKLIAEGRVQVNGQTVTTLGFAVDARHDVIAVDGATIGQPQRASYWLLNKPRGYVCTVRDTHGRRTVLDLVPSEERLYPVGRLDVESEGLVLLTNDGVLAHRLMHPRFAHDKEYQVLVSGKPSPSALSRWSTGMELDGVTTSPARVTTLRARRSSTWLQWTMHEGRKRQIRRMCQAAGHSVLRLVRVRIGPLVLAGLKPGQSRPLSQDEVQMLRQAAGLSAATPARKPDRLAE